MSILFCLCKPVSLNSPVLPSKVPCISVVFPTLPSSVTGSWQSVQLWTRTEPGLAARVSVSEIRIWWGSRQHSEKGVFLFFQLNWQLENRTNCALLGAWGHKTCPGNHYSPRSWVFYIPFHGKSWWQVAYNPLLRGRLPYWCFPSEQRWWNRDRRYWVLMHWSCSVVDTMSLDRRLNPTMPWLSCSYRTRVITPIVRVSPATQDCNVK